MRPRPPSALRTYSAEYKALAAQLDTYRHAREWMEMGVPAVEAAQWANLGYLPEEAAPSIATGITAATSAEMERHAEEAAGGPDELLAQRLQQMVETGEIVDPARVIRILDPTDPNCEIIAVRED